MKKYLLILMAACLGLVACEKNSGQAAVYPGQSYHLFRFVIFDAEGNNVAMQDGFAAEELSLEFLDKVFYPQEGFQKFDENDVAPGHYHNAVKFEPSIWPDENGVDHMTWMIIGMSKIGETSRYVLRYKDNEWVVDFSTKKIEGSGVPYVRSAIVNGEVCEMKLILRVEDHEKYESQDQRNIYMFPLYIK